MTAARAGKAAALIAAAILGLTACSGSSDTDDGDTNPTPTAEATTPAPSAAEPEVKLTPSKNLHNGQKVQVVGTGYVANDDYQAIECANKGAATTGADCNLRNIVPQKADADGVVTLEFTVAAVFNHGAINCTKAPGCVISVANGGAKAATPTEVGLAKLNFG